MFRKVLIANRGEIALRILRACRELDISTVAVHSTADAAAMHVRLADESVCIGPPAASDSYLNAVSILAAAEITGADAIHPGYGFLAENADFAQMVVEHGFTFIGPDPRHIRTMGGQDPGETHRQGARAPRGPRHGEAVTGENAAREAARTIGYPLLIKAVAGGGGRGMTVVHDESGLVEAMKLARYEARMGFGDDRVYLERYLDHPRHIEVQILGDRAGNVIHLGERDCTLQRRHQKLVEEAPSPVLSAVERARVGEQAAAAMRRLGYATLGTIEFLWQDGAFYFIEMNTRLQVEHPVTEMVTGLDLVREQIRVAARQPAQPPAERRPLRRACDRGADQRGKLAHVEPVTREGHLIPPAGRAWRPRRLGALYRLHGAALLRQLDCQVDRARRRS